jgi:hypothetical protein
VQEHLAAGQAAGQAADMHDGQQGGVLMESGCKATKGHAYLFFKHSVCSRKAALEASRAGTPDSRAGGSRAQHHAV